MNPNEITVKEFVGMLQGRPFKRMGPVIKIFGDYE